MAERKMPLYHINFHTLNSIPVFENDSYDGAMREYLRGVLREHRILCPAWELMPTHLHMIVEDFPDQPRGTIVKYVKGATSHAFFTAFPELRADLLGGHLWTKGYHFVLIASHRQFLATLDYVRTNRQDLDLPPPAPLESAS